MKKLLFLFLPFLSLNVFSQSTGDTIIVKTFKYGSATRDTAIQFPNNSTTYEKIIMRYNMRCKNGLVSTGSQRNLGCGEWDYSCNTYVVDSSRMEVEALTYPSHIISNFTGTVFPYTTIAPYDYYTYNQTNVSYSVTSESQYTVGVGTTTVSNLLNASQRSGRTQILYTAAELTSAGFTAGTIDGLLLDVANAGGTANFFNLGIKQTTLTALSSASLSLTSFTTVYNSNYTFVNGSNRIQFMTPFNWNGTDNIILDYSFTNSMPGTNILFNGVTTASVNALYANNNYAVDLSSNGQINLNTTFLSGISNQLTVAFWVYGNANQMPANTSVMYAYASNPNDRTLNVHLPWSDNSIYFDCGFSSGGFDRINKNSTAANQGGQWNHWAFTKNATTGWMRIYLNGVLWYMGSGKAKPISILNMLLGKDAAGNNNYKGRINEFSMWDKELALADVKSIMNTPILPSHPLYSNLVAYYKMDEGTGTIVNDTKNAVTSTGTNIIWTFDRGNKLNRMFMESNAKPNITFLRGTYSISTNTVIVKDSIARNTSTIQQYSITSNATVTPMTNDVVTLVSTTTNLYDASPSKIFDGVTLALTGTVAVAAQGSITITPLNYYNRHPYYIELMSFVTPYGIGLDYGMNGKTWYFDMSDYAPLLKGKKRFLMTLGGEWQEQMDIDFLFIVGTPPKTVLECNQLWQGGARWGGSSIASINNDTRYSVLSVPTNSAATSFKMRSTITGHGAEGEFGQNGGYTNHYFNINGGPNEFSWKITRECSVNPITAQGGTWVYERQGWCPGQYSLLKEYNVTPYITPGSTVSLDYNCSAPANPGGDYRYIAAHQLISYGSPNHSLDVAIVDVKKPGNKVVYSRENPMCARPVIVAQNTGSTTITSIDIDYWMNNNTSKETYQWTGSLNFMDTVSITLPIGNLWSNGVLPSNNKFNVELKKANSSVDNYVYNNKYSSAFNLPDVLTDSLTIEVKTNSMPTENSYVLMDDNGNIIPGASVLSAANTVYTDKYILNGCYKMIFEDTGEDGLEWWASTAQGSGYVQFKNNQGTVIKTFNSDFGRRFEYSFTTKQYLYAGIKENELSTSMRLYPNPARDKFEIVMENTENVKVNVTDMMGRDFELPFTRTNTKLIFNSSSLNSGVYLVKITKDNATSVKKLVID